MIYLILLVHWFADFVLQTRKQATNKSTSNYWLGKHVAAYTACLMPFGWKFALINGAAHFWTDFFTSRATSRAWKAQNTHVFFAIIGWDQFLHTILLIWSIPYAGW